jgi:purine-nucleoside phosphorylase
VTGDRVGYGDIEEMPVSTVPGHEGTLFAGTVEDVPVLAFAGRVHLYEGFDTSEVTYAVRAAIGAGCETVILTNAAGGIRHDLAVGAPCLISDHINLTGTSPLLGPNDDSIGPRFLDLSRVYDPELQELAVEIDPRLQKGVYAGLLGPTYETPAEIRMLRSMGADLVGMSTVIEAIAARYLGARVLGISLVSNLAAGIGDTPLSHEEVTAAGRAGAPKLKHLLRGILSQL